MSAGVAADRYDSGVLNINGRWFRYYLSIFEYGNTAEIRLQIEIGADKIINLTPGQIYDAVTNQTQMPLKIQNVNRV